MDLEAASVGSGGGQFESIGGKVMIKGEEGRIDLETEEDIGISILKKQKFKLHLELENCLIREDTIR